MSRSVKKSSNKRNGGNNNAPKRNENYENKSSGSENKTGSEEDSKEGDKSEESSDKGRSRGGRRINDPEWYARDLQLLTDSASLNFADPLGKPVSLVEGGERIWGSSPTTNPGLYVSAQVTEEAIGGICSLRMKHTVGQSLDRTSAVNNAANAWYTFVRYVNSGRKNYDPADLMMYGIAIADMYAFISWCKRLYGYAFLYSQRNMYIGKCLVEENYVNPDDLVSNLANFRYWVNTFISKVAAYAIPKDLPYFSRRVFMYDGLYIENPYENLKDQLYQFVPDGFYKFDFDSQGAGKCTWTALGTSLLTTAQIEAFGNALLSNVFGDEDFGLMSGDVLKAYDSNIMTLTQLESEYLVLPHYDMYVLSQFKNATIVGAAERTDRSTPNVYFTSPNDPSSANRKYNFGDVSQDTVGNIVCLEGVIGENTDAGAMQFVNVFCKKVLSVEVPQPTPADNIEASRCMVIGSRGTTQSLSAPSGTEVSVLLTGVDFPISVSIRYGLNVSDATVYTSNARYGFAKDVEQFKYAPIPYEIATTTAVGRTIDKIVPRSNIDNYTVVNGYVLNKMHECALLSLFFVPGVAKLVNYMK